MATEQVPAPQIRDGLAYFIRLDTTPEDVASTVALFREYAASLNTEVQDFASELANMPGKYSQPTGTLLLARTCTGMPIECVGVRPLGDPGTCEMKRFYVSPLGRGTKLGKLLALEALDQARNMGHGWVRLDTLRSMASAKALYKELGFVEVEPYYNNPLEGTSFLELDLEEKR